MNEVEDEWFHAQCVLLIVMENLRLTRGLELIQLLFSIYWAKQVGYDILS